jgi:RNA polymerase sigma factor (sigma-70 family)
MRSGPLTHRTGSSDPSTASPAVEPTDRELLHRFHRLRDQAAFELLLRRHGPMVLGVCRRVLAHTHDAEDAFQATFLVLVRRAGTIRDPELLANFLYGVAYRVARKSRARLARQSQCERRATSMPVEEVYSDLAWQELRSVLDEELQALPAKYQAPLVLCYLEGMTNEQAARRLGWPPGSMSYRLAKGREMLRERLARRDQAYSANLLSLVLMTKVAVDSLSDELVQSTIRAAFDLAGATAGAGGDNKLQKLLKSAAPDARSGAILALLVILTLGLATSVVARGFLDPGPAAPSVVPRTDMGEQAASQSDSARHQCHQ